ncbi:hypothetical protein KJ652_04795 [Patescibacteria group bacterium]|nr:hypothetical protein [Patescibacteria group bacterium]MBU1123883.1 hypothetical protein [Patescibacteria group bacterium]MBU1910989.1 hypothetical protein [Patescibacteria group bacterium]
METKDKNQRQHSPTSSVIVDWSTACDANPEGMIEWLKQYPRKGDIHVYLPSISRRAQLPRLRSTLQGLGCTVTAVKNYA